MNTRSGFPTVRRARSRGQRVCRSRARHEGGVGIVVVVVARDEIHARSILLAGPPRIVSFMCAVTRIRGAIFDELRTIDWVPRSVRQKAREVEETVRRLESSLGRAASDEEIAAGMEMELKEFQQMMLKISGTSMLSLHDIWYTGEDNDKSPSRRASKAPAASTPTRSSRRRRSSGSSSTPSRSFRRRKRRCSCSTITRT